MTNRVCGVVVTFNRKQYLKRTLAALAAQTKRLDELIVVDNASTDGTGELLKEEYPQVRVVSLPFNTGGAGGFCAGLKAAYDTGCDWFWVMDDDVLPDPSALRLLLDPGDGLDPAIDPHSCVRAPLRVWEDGTCAESAAVRLDLSEAAVLPRNFKNPVFKIYAETAVPPVLEVADVTFEGPLFHRSAVEAAGFPSPDWFIYGDDTDFSLRLSKKGFRHFVVSAARLTRLIRPATNEAVPWRRRFQIRNTLWLLRKHGAGRQVSVLRTSYWALWMLGASLVRLQPFTRPALFKAIFTGVTEGVLQEVPKDGAPPARA